ncbi:DUF6600 domain-containing protein [Anaeromyxobacter diazotrophicus]|uniref:YXWGXW repeat protein n=1 Tax=Anaeromyxobacter diazotrophicus TaxID=2590199 RepID=A0A7I9VM77_9BACT|nr:DUF6600 domain-containing protein [Anaeromyxobacter diazotrophicus]GEJ57229.1 hypothetical protein AMYX_19700 [Anaeromyxobacter diazotrophicus]
MTRHLAIALGLALALPALAQDDGYADQDEYGQAWDDSYEPEAPPPDDGGARVDVNVDMGAAGAGVTFDTFRDGLAPYGEWVNAGAYGRVWRPTHVAAGWRPYYYGRWQWTDEGWLWDSEESWGWATYHYGRWAYDPSYGWVWAPGYQWAPAWVTWRYGPEYVGWAPLAPGFSVYVSSYPFAYSWWSFVPCNRFAGVPVYSVAYTGGYVRNIFRGTQPAPPRASVYGAVAPAWGGPARPFVERSVGHAIAPVRLQPVGSPVAAAAPSRGGVVSIYRPDVRPAPAGRPTAIAPSRPWGSPSSAAIAPGRAAPRPSGAWRGGATQAPSAPRQYAPAPRQYTPAPRQYSPAPRQYAPSPRQYAPAPGGGMRPQGGGGFAPRAAPQLQGGGAPRGGGVAPHGGGGGGGGHVAAPAPHRR